MKALTAAGFADSARVSHETLQRLGVYLDLLARWNTRINLVSQATLLDPWRRHILDSVQLQDDLRDVAGPIADLGSGAGLPGMVLAILGQSQVFLLESDQRKCAFLRTVARETGTSVTIREGRIESIPGVGAEAIVARACAPLARLLELAEPHLGAGGRAVLLKGRSIDSEMDEARPCWSFDAKRRPSLTDPEGCILRLENIARV
ncbi:ribosomal RNA small subunit methyltransferase G [Allostella sp. ATCC 35155]|nr:ribosomal RNA small subunit methyltransferase G [Stella sp. ATCC 35155]